MRPGPSHSQPKGTSKLHVRLDGAIASVALLGTMSLCAATDALATVQGPIDILRTQATLLDGGSGNIVGFNIDTSQLLSGAAELTITRTYTDATPTEQEHYSVNYNYDGTNFDARYASEGTDTGVVVDASNVGQFTYTASSKANTDTIIATFTAKATISYRR